MRRSRQSDPLSGRPPCLPRTRSAGSDAGRHAAARRAFTLIELIFVLALLAISAGLVAARAGNFFRGRALNFEARRMLSLTHLAQSRAVSEGVPVVIWVNPTNSTYGLTVLSSFNDPEGDDRAVTHTADESLTLETPLGDQTLLSEQDDEKLGLPEGYAAIRFNPDGFIDESSVSKITIRQGNQAALDLGLTVNGLAYEIRPGTNLN
jgi:prepilin-type N-terminal cleavage/methylation domain-containing protein